MINGRLTICFSPYRHLLGAAIDNELSGDDLSAVQAHVTDCARCSREIESLSLARKAVSHLEFPAAEGNYAAVERRLRRDARTGVLTFPPRTGFASPPRPSRIRGFAIGATATIGLFVFVAAWAIHSRMHRDALVPTNSAIAPESSNTAKSSGSGEITKTESTVPSTKAADSMTKRNSTVTARRTTGVRHVSIKPQEISLPDLTDVADVRGGDNDVQITPRFAIFRFRLRATPLTIALPDNSRRGEYVVGIRTAAYLEPVKTGSNVSDGRRLFVELALQDVQPGNYMLFVARKGNSGEDYIGVYPLEITEASSLGKDVTK
jgi:hypothetical protein